MMMMMTTMMRVLYCCVYLQHCCCYCCYYRNCRCFAPVRPFELAPSLADCPLLLQMQLLHHSLKQ